MAVRMVCADCFEVAVPDTVLEGSDLLELLAWACFGIPGLLYCWWVWVQSGLGDSGRRAAFRATGVLVPLDPDPDLP